MQMRLYPTVLVPNQHKDPFQSCQATKNTFTCQASPHESLSLLISTCIDSAKIKPLAEKSTDALRLCVATEQMQIGMLNSYADAFAPNRAGPKSTQGLLSILSSNQEHIHVPSKSS